jgi:hypothetical protein
LSTVFKTGEREMSKTKNQIYMGIIIIALGVIMTSAMPGIPRPLGFVFIGIGVIVFTFGIRKKKARDNL